MEHHRRSANHHDQLHLWCHLYLRLVLVVKVLKDAVVVLDVLHGVLGPSVKLQIEWVELVVQKLHARHTGHQHTPLELDGTLNLDGIRHPLVLCANLLDVAVNRQTGARLNALLDQPSNLVQQVRLLVLDGLVALRRRLVSTPGPKSIWSLLPPLWSEASVVLHLLSIVILLVHWGRRRGPLPRVHEHVHSNLVRRIPEVLTGTRRTLGKRTRFRGLGTYGNRLSHRNFDRDFIQQAGFSIVKIHRRHLHSETFLERKLKALTH